VCFRLQPDRPSRCLPRREADSDRTRSHRGGAGGRPRRGLCRPLRGAPERAVQHRAADLTATAFLRAFRALSGYDRERIAALRTRPWLLTILLNAWRNQVRTAARQPREVLDAEPPEAEARGASVEAQAERHETSRELAALLDLLPDRQRVAVVLRHVADLPIAEVASVLGCPPGTAKSHVSRGLRRLRELEAARVRPDDPALNTEGVTVS
jgi:RNA polymerase sigma factor (sigma-70 family)